MTSNIDPTVPVSGQPTTASVRQNFQTAATEITALQNATNGSPFLPLAGGNMTGAIYLAGDPTDSRMPATKAYVDTHGTGGGGGIPEAPADGTLYGRQNGAWLHAVDTATMNAAISAAVTPDAPNDGNIYGRQSHAWVVTITPAQVDAKIAAAAYQDAPNDGRAYLRQSAAWHYGVPQLSLSNNVVIRENGTGANKNPLMAAVVSPVNPTSDMFRVQCRQLTAPDSNGNYGDAAAVDMYGPSSPNNPNGVSLWVGSHANGYQQFAFEQGGTAVFPGTLSTAGALSVTGAISATTTITGTAGLGFNDVNSPAQSWSWHAGSGSARLTSAGFGDVLSIVYSTGAFYTAAQFNVPNGGGSYSYIGNHLVGNPSCTFFGSSGLASDPIVRIQAIAGWSGSDILQCSGAATGRIAGVTSAGTVFGTGPYVDITSFRNAKDELSPIDEPEAVIARLRPRQYRHKTLDRKQHGFVIEDLLDDFPEAVARGPDGEPEGYYPTMIIGSLVATVQALLGRVAALEAKGA
jgi:hypothetical protein